MESLEKTLRLLLARFFSTLHQMLKALSCLHSWRSMCFAWAKIRQRMLPAKEWTF